MLRDPHLNVDKVLLIPQPLDHREASDVILAPEVKLDPVHLVRGCVVGRLVSVDGLVRGTAGEVEVVA